MFVKQLAMTKKIPFKIQYKPDFSVIGIFCPAKDYRLCWILNHELKYDFQHFGTFQYKNPGSENAESFNIFEYSNEVLFLRVFMLNNKNDNTVLFKSPPQLDYLMLIQSGDSRYNIENTIKALRKIPLINAAYHLDNKLGKNSDEVLYDLELFIADVDNSAKHGS